MTVADWIAHLRDLARRQTRYLSAGDCEEIAGLLEHHISSRFAPTEEQLKVARRVCEVVVTGVPEQPVEIEFNGADLSPDNARAVAYILPELCDKADALAHRVLREQVESARVGYESAQRRLAEFGAGGNDKEAAPLTEGREV